MSKLEEGDIQLKTITTMGILTFLFLTASNPAVAGPHCYCRLNVNTSEVKNFGEIHEFGRVETGKDKKCNDKCYATVVAAKDSYCTWAPGGGLPAYRYAVGADSYKNGETTLKNFFCAPRTVTISYGIYPSKLLTKVVTRGTSVACTNSNFGGDPLYGTVKYCYEGSTKLATEGASFIAPR